jgi:hypothetical protein
MPHEDTRDPYIVYHAGDASPPLTYQIKEAENQAIGDADPVDLGNVEEVRFAMVNDDGIVVEDQATVVQPSQGIVEYDFDVEQIGAKGSYFGEFRVYYTAMDKETFPKRRDIWVQVVPSNFDGEVVNAVPRDGDVDTLDARVARIGEGFYAPVYTDLSNAAKELGNIVYVDGSGPDTEGVYRYNGAQFDNFDNATDALVSDDGIEVVNSLAELNARSDLEVTDLGNGVAAVDLADPVTNNIDNQRTRSQELSDGVAGPENTVSRIMGERIERQSPSGASEISLTNVFDGTYHRYMLDISDASVSDNPESIEFQFSEDGGSTWISAPNYQWSTHEVFSGGGNTATAGGSGVDSGVALRAMRRDGSVNLSIVPRGRVPTWWGTGHYLVSGDSRIFRIGGELKDSSPTVDSVRLFNPGPGTFSASVALYGVMF